MTLEQEPFTTDRSRELLGELMLEASASGLLCSVSSSRLAFGNKRPAEKRDEKGRKEESQSQRSQDEEDRASMAWHGMGGLNSFPRLIPGIGHYRAILSLHIAKKEFLY